MRNSVFKLLILILIISMSASLLTVISSAKKISDGVSLLNPKQNVYGDGYEWQNRTDTLVLDNLNIDTADEYGLKIPDGATVVINGDNYIKASKAALYIGGNVIIRGSGTLTLVGGDYGIYFNSVNNTHKLSITSGKITISAKKCGIFAEFSKVALAGCNLEIDSEGDYGINVREFSTSAGSKLTSNSTVFASYSMLIQATKLSVESDKSALEISPGRTIKIENATIKTGDALSALSDSEEYNGEKAISTVSTFDNSPKSILFGEGYSIAIDIILLTVALLLLSSAIIIPPILKKKKAEKIISKQIELENVQKRLKKLKKRNKN